MKVRQGFVSNSSTTSFCIYGVTNDEDSLKEKLFELHPEFKSLEVDDDGDEQDVYFGDLTDEVNKKLKTHL